MRCLTSICGHVDSVRHLPYVCLTDTDHTGDEMDTYSCQTCGTELKSYEAVLRGNAIDPEPLAWCRRDAVALGILKLPMPRVEILASV